MQQTRYSVEQPLRYLGCGELMNNLRGHIVRFTDLDRLNLVKNHDGGLVLGSSQFPVLSQVPQK